MKIDNRLIYAIIGSLLTLLFVFAFKLIFLSESLVPNTAVNTNTDVDCQAYIEEELGDDIVSIVNTNQQYEEEIDEPIESDINDDDDCNEECVSSYVDQLLSGKNLSDDDDGFSLTSQLANQIAERFKNDPSSLSEAETTFSSLRDQSSRDSFLYVFGRLPDDQIQELARRLSSSKNTRDRADSLSLLQSVSSNNFDVQNEIKQVISTENDPDILLRAIKVSHSLDPEQVDGTTKARLSNLINTSDDEEIRSAALITKMRVVKNDPSLQNDITMALNSPSKRFTEAGLQALDNMLNDDDESGNYIGDNAALQKNVERIANDPNADPATRVEALNLIRRHY